MDNTDLKQPLFTPDINEILKRIYKYILIFAIISFSFCIGIPIYCFSTRKECNYIWYLVYGYGTLLILLCCHYVAYAKDRTGSKLIFTYFLNGMVILFDACSLIWSIVKLIKTYDLIYCFILVADILQSICSIQIICKTAELASVIIFSYDESYSILSLFRLIFLTEKQHRFLKLGSYVFLTVFSIIQYSITVYSKCASPTIYFALSCIGVFIIMFILYLPLYGWQVQKEWVRIFIAISAPLVLTIAGIISNGQYNKYMCAQNYSLSVLTKIESILLTICGLIKLLLAIYTKTESYLYSQDFEKANKETEARIENEMKAALQGDFCINSF